MLIFHNASLTITILPLNGTKKSYQSSDLVLKLSPLHWYMVSGIVSLPFEDMHFQSALF